MTGSHRPRYRSGYEPRGDSFAFVRRLEEEFIPDGGKADGGHFRSDDPQIIAAYEAITLMRSGTQMRLAPLYNEPSRRQRPAACPKKRA